MESMIQTFYQQQQPQSQLSTRSLKDSFLVAQLKRSIRELKATLAQKEQSLKEYKLQGRLQKLKEAESERDEFQTECARLRDLLEKQIQASQASLLQAAAQPVQVSPRKQEQNQFDFRKLFMDEREKLLQCQTELNRANSALHQLKEKPRGNEQKKMQELVSDNKRQHLIIESKSKAIDELKCEVARLLGVQQKYDKVNQLLKETVTRKCALEAACSAKDKRLEEQQGQIKEMELR